jgi:transposase
VDGVGCCRWLDLSAFYAAYRADGHGRPAYEPSMMVALLMYAYARGNRSARGIERACVEDVAYRAVAANLVPDHSTIADFRCRHERALAEVFSGVLGLCAQVGLASVGVVAIDGTKLSANASMNANRDFGQIARAILREAAEIDQREDELYGPDRGDELPEQLRTRDGRRRALRDDKERLQREHDQAAETEEDGEDPVELELDPQHFVTRPQGRRAWLREGRRALEAQRGREGRSIAGDRAERLFEACRRLEQELDADRAANVAYGHWRAHGVAADGSRRMAPGMVKPFELPEVPSGLMNVTITTRAWCARRASRGCRATTPSSPSTTARSRSPPNHRTSATSNRWSAPPSANSPRSASRIRTSCWPTPATGTSARCSRSPTKASKCSSHPTRGCARAVGRAGTAAFMRRVPATPQGQDLYRQRLPPAPDHDRANAVSDRVQLALAQLALAREFGFASWRRLKSEVERREILTSRDLSRLRRLRVEEPELARIKMEHWRDHRQALPLGFMAMLRF